MKIICLSILDNFSSMAIHKFINFLAQRGHFFNMPTRTDQFFVFCQPWESLNLPILGFDSVYFSRVLLNIQKPPVCVWVPGWFLGKLYFLVIPSFTHNNGVITTGEAFESYFVGHRGGAWVTIRPGLGHFWRSQKEEWRYRGSWCGRELQMLRVMIFVDFFLTFWLFCVFETCYYVILCWLIWNMIS